MANNTGVTNGDSGRLVSDLDLHVQHPLRRAPAHQFHEPGSQARGGSYREVRSECNGFGGECQQGLLSMPKSR